MRRRLLALLCLAPAVFFAQLSINQLNSTYTIDFDNSLSGVNNGTFLGNGFASSPGTGALNSGAWRVNSWSGVTLAFGGTETSNEFAKGASNGNVGNTSAVNGMYGFNTASPLATEDRSLGWYQASGSDFDPGIITLRLKNTSGQTITALRFTYEAKQYNKGGGSNEIVVAYSPDDALYTDISSLQFDTDTAAASSPDWESSNKNGIIDNITWNDGDYFYVSFTSTQTSSGSTDELAIDDIKVRAYNADYVWDGSWIPSTPTGDQSLSNALVFPVGTAPIASNVSFQNFYMEPGSKLDISSGQQLSVADTAYFLANGFGNSQVMGEVLGTSAYQVYYRADSARWLNVAVPVDATFDDVTGIPISATGNPNSTNVWYYDASLDTNGDGEGEFMPISSTTQPTDDIGYQIYAGDGTYFGTGPFTMQTAGSLLDGDQTITVSAATTLDYNIIPNPYPSTVEWNAFRNDADNEVNATYYVQDGSLSSVVYRTYNGTSGTNGGSNDIPPGQSFFVQVQNSTDGTLIFKNAQRNLTGNTAIYKTQSGYEYLKLKATHTPSGLADETVIGFDNSFTDNMDADFDGAKMYNYGYPNIYTKTNGKAYTFNGLNDEWTTKDVELDFKGDKAGNYTIQMEDDLFPATWTIVLEDKVTGTSTNLRKGSYSFNHAVGDNADRFILHFNKNGAVGLSENDLNTIYTYVKGHELQVNLGDLKDATIHIYNIDGGIMYDQNASGMAKVDMHNWASGLYIVQVSKEGISVFRNKIINQ